MEKPEVGSLCPVCGEDALIRTDEPVTVEFRDGTYVVDGFEYDRCTACGEEYYRAGQVDAIHAKAAALARADLGRLTPEEIAQLRVDLGLTQSALEGAIGVGPGTVGRWERGSVLHGATADRLMRILRAHPELLSECRSEAEPSVARETRGPYRKRR